METEKLINWIRLINTETIGPISFFKLKQRYDSIEDALQEVSKRHNVPSKKEAEEEIKKAEKQNIKILSFEDEDYPKHLKHLGDAPPILYVKGNSKLLKQEQALSVVGARNASINGRKQASRLSYDLTENDILIISGMARGIDTAAHKGALYAKNQSGATIAVLGTGVDVPYPSENAPLYEQISEQGAIISELPLGTQPQSNNFPRRNRIVAGLSLGTLVVEATLNSGSLITARLALEQGKEIFAIPGSPLEGRSSGCNKLIKEGAILIENYEDILKELPLFLTKHREESHSKEELGLFDKPLDKVKNNRDIPEKVTPLSDVLTEEGILIDDLIQLSGLSGTALSTELLKLEMENKIKYLSGNKVALVKHKR